MLQKRTAPAPGRTYRFTVSFKLATDVEAGLVGIGGAPGESVAVKCGVTTQQPQTIFKDSGSFEYFRMNIDTGAQGNGGKDMVVVGDMTKAENNRPGEYEFKEFHAELEAAANIRGEVWLIIAADSGYEATTSYYLDDISVQWDETEQPAATRAQAAQMLFHTADRASADNDGRIDVRHWSNRSCKLKPLLWGRCIVKTKYNSKRQNGGSNESRRFMIRQ